MKCPKCSSERTVGNGSSRGIKRRLCRNCGKSFATRKPKHSKEKKQKAIEMYLNNVGIRKIGVLLKVGPTSVLEWIRNSAALVQEQLDNMLEKAKGGRIKTDIIEMDEIYTYVKKNKTGYRYGLLILENKLAFLRLSSKTKGLKAH